MTDFLKKFQREEAPAAQALSIRTVAPTLSLNAINDRLHPLKLTISGLGKLGFNPDWSCGSALYRECDWPAIKRAIINHVAGLP